MKTNRSANAVRNIFFGIILKVYQIGVPFIMRTMVIYYLGMDYLGLNTLFASVLQAINLAELGIDSAIAFCMYRPIVEEDTATICATMRLLRRQYRIIGSIIGVLGLALVPFVPRMIKGGIPPDLNIYLLYILYLCSTVLSYWLFSYKTCLLNAHQREDICSRIILVVVTVQYAAQIAVLVFLRSYLWYLILSLANQVVANVITAIVATRRYPDYRPRGELDEAAARDIRTRVWDLFTMRIGSVMINSVDSVVISAVLGLTVLAVFQNYYFILVSVVGFVTVFFTACTAGIGNSLIVETKEKNYADLMKFSFLICWISGFCTCCLLCLYQPFMELWVGDGYLLSISAVVSLCLYYYLFEFGQLLNTFKDAAGIWHTDRFRPWLTAAVNLVLNMIFVRIWGVTGIALATALATAFVSVSWMLHALFHQLFEPGQLKHYLLTMLGYAGVILAVCALTFWVCSLVHLSPFLNLIARGVICVILPNLLFLLCWHKRKEFSQCIALAMGVLKRK